MVLTKYLFLAAFLPLLGACTLGSGQPFTPLQDGGGPNQPPVAVCPSDFNTAALETIGLEGRLSYDPDRQPLTSKGQITLSPESRSITAS